MKYQPGFTTYTTATKESTGESMTLDDLCRLFDEAFLPSQRQLDRFKALLVEHHGFDFETYQLVISETFAKEVGLTLPMPYRHDDDVIITDRLEGNTMLCMKKFVPFFQIDPFEYESV